MQCPFCKEEIIDGAIKCKHCGSNLENPIQSGTQATMDFVAFFNTSLNIWKSNLSDLILLTLVFLVVCWIPIANIGFISGYTRSLIKVARGQGRSQVGDLFTAWDCFGNLLVYLLLYLTAAVILHFVPFIGSLASIALGFLVVPGIYAIIDARKDPLEAIKWGMATIQADFVNWFLAYLVGNVIIFSGFMLLFIGALLTAPLGQLIIIQQYERCKSA